MTPRDLDSLESQVAEARRIGMGEVGTLVYLPVLEALVRDSRELARLRSTLEREPAIYDPAASAERGLCVDVRGCRCCLFVDGIPACARCSAPPPRVRS